MSAGACDMFFDSFWLVAGVWCLHDLVGSSVWYPIQERYVQLFARPESRGADVAKVAALTTLGSVIGIALAGHVMDFSAGLPALPFLVGGGICCLSSLILIRL